MPARRDPLTSVVVVGAGLAATRTVVALREQGFLGLVTVLGDEGVEPYDRPPLSKELLVRTTPAWLRDELGADLGTADDVRLATPATGLSLDPAGGVRVSTADDTLEADAVVLATGAHAIRPHGWDTALTLHTAADAVRLRESLRPGARLVVVGAGWIGAEVAGVAAAAGVQVTVVEAAATPLMPALGPAVGALTAPWYAQAGIHLVLGATVAEVSRAGVTLDDGRAFEADLVLAAVGARPSSAWLADALPRALDGSLEVDEAYRVLTDAGPLPHVSAVGDLARRRSRRHGWVPGGHWDGALKGPEVAVRALLGDDSPPDDPAPYVFSTQLGHDLALYGLPTADDEVVLRGDPAEGFTALWFRPGTDTLTAVFAVDHPRDVSAARRLFRGPELPTVDRDAARDPGRPLR